MKTFGAIILVLALLLPASAAEASTAEQACLYRTLDTSDMAGYYADPTGPMEVTIDACGSVIVGWGNPYGWHRASYEAITPFAGGGFAARGALPDAWGYLDGRPALGVKPGTPGSIEVLTLSAGATSYKLYVLRKIR